MKNKKETRTCIGCRKKDYKYNLIRMVKNTDIELDLKFNKQGRGFYICKNEECLKKAIKNKGLKLNLDNKKYDELRGVILGRK